MQKLSPGPPEGAYGIGSKLRPCRDNGASDVFLTWLVIGCRKISGLAGACNIFHDLVMQDRPEDFYSVVIPGRMDAVGEKHHQNAAV